MPPAPRILLSYNHPPFLAGPTHPSLSVPAKQFSTTTTTTTTDLDFSILSSLVLHHWLVIPFRQSAAEIFRTSSLLTVRWFVLVSRLSQRYSASLPVLLRLTSGPTPPHFPSHLTSLLTRRCPSGRTSTMPLRSLQGVPVRDQHRLKLTFPFMGIPDANMRVHCADVFREVLTVVVATFSLPPGSYSLIWYVEGPTDLPHRDVSRLLLAPNETPALVSTAWRGTAPISSG